MFLKENVSRVFFSTCWNKLCFHVFVWVVCVDFLVVCRLRGGCDGDCDLDL